MIAEYYMIYKIMNKFLFAMKKIIMKKKIACLSHCFIDLHNTKTISEFLTTNSYHGSTVQANPSVPTGRQLTM